MGDTMAKEAKGRGRGRPAVLVGGGQHLVYLDAASIEAAAIKGTKGVSQGIRNALGAAAPSVAGSKVPPRRSGRGPGLVGGERRNVYLDTACVDVALILGDGYISAGIRKALRQAVAARAESGRAPAEQVESVG